MRGICPSCKQEAEFEYIGDMGDEEGTYRLYNCSKCGSTVVERKIKDVPMRSV